MRILFYFDHQINPERGGTERATDVLAHAFLEKGHITFYMARYKEYPIGDIPIFFLPQPQEVASSDNISFVEYVVNTENIDVIVNQGTNGNDIYLFNRHTLNVRSAIVSCLHFSVYEGLNYFSQLTPYVFSLVKPWETCMSCLRWLKQPYNQRKAMQGKRKRFSFIYEHSDAVVVLSPSYIEDYVKVACLSDLEKLYSFPNPVSFSMKKCVNEQNKEKEILFVGRLSYSEKRVDRLLAAWRLIHLRHLDWRLSIVGDGPDRARLESLVRKWNLQRVTFWGYQSPLPFYQKASIFCLASTHEGLPMVLIEAMQNQTVPIAFDSFGAAHDMIQSGRNGILVSPFNIKVYALAMEELIRNAASRVQMGKQAYMDVVERYDRSKIVERWIDFLMKLKS